MLCTSLEPSLGCAPADGAGKENVLCTIPPRKMIRREMAIVEVDLEVEMYFISQVKAVERVTRITTHIPGVNLYSTTCAHDLHQREVENIRAPLSG